jgi:hypothetical protein
MYYGMCLVVTKHCSSPYMDIGRPPFLAVCTRHAHFEDNLLVSLCSCWSAGAWWMLVSGKGGGVPIVALPDCAQAPSIGGALHTKREPTCSGLASYAKKCLQAEDEVLCKHGPGRRQVQYCSFVGPGLGFGTQQTEACSPGNAQSSATTIWNGCTEGPSDAVWALGNHRYAELRTLYGVVSLLADTTTGKQSHSRVQAFSNPPQTMFCVR